MFARHLKSCMDLFQPTLLPQLCHWLPFQHRIAFSISALVPRCLLGLAPAYPRELCYLTLGTRGCSSFRSMEQGGTLCPFCPYFNSPGLCILGGWPLCLEWASIGTAIAPQGS